MDVVVGRWGTVTPGQVGWIGAVSKFLRGGVIETGSSGN